MCDTNSSKGLPSRRSVLGAAMAGAGGVVASSLAGGAAKAATLPGFKNPNPLRPTLPVLPSQPLGTVLTQLGTAGGPQAEYVRTGTSTVLTVDGWNYVIDAGRSSVTQYLNSGLVFNKLAGIFITHLHADHLADYFNYFLLEGGQPNAERDMLRHAPPKPAVPVPTFGPGSAGTLPPPPAGQTDPPVAPNNPVPGLRTLTDRMIEAYAYSFNVFIRGDGYHSIYDFTSDVNDITIPASAQASATNRAPAMKPFKIFADKRVEVSAILVPHGSVFPCFAYRFDLADGRSVVFSGDTSKSDNVILLAQDADLLVHEVINLDFIKKFDKNINAELLAHLEASHTTTEQVSQVAQAAGVPKLVLTHLIPSNPLDVPDWLWEAKCRGGYRGVIHVGNDGDQMPIVPRSRMSMSRYSR